MRYLITALLAIYAAEPFANALMKSPLAPTLAAIHQSPAVLSVFGKPELMFQILFVLLCYQLVCAIEYLSFQMGMGTSRMVQVSGNPYGAVAVSTNSAMQKAVRQVPVDVKKPE